jgi:hypothetical protein
MTLPILHLTAPVVSKKPASDRYVRVYRMGNCGLLPAATALTVVLVFISAG